MFIKTISNQIRNDLYGTLECEFCRATQKFIGYDDLNWHRRVLLHIKCDSCGQSTVTANTLTGTK